MWNDESYLNQYFHFNKPTLVVLYKNFQFITSDKGGLGIERKTGFDIEELKLEVYKNPEKLFNLVNGKIQILDKSLSSIISPKEEKNTKDPILAKFKINTNLITYFKNRFKLI